MTLFKLLKIYIFWP